ncbi:hypothetical protein FVEG_11282 [Fusarium verticillioides 7600]|uniref:Small EDRK-rich factor-like N-terminal domain-containing protein n=1 Tax=Gibberella moniliformis (strain M3125 / FGSC 7600) TaxID=334819 RepID=W7MXJ9_GIBM7|nr:hypothetical protein FVEG_11282 [Fusarium verticillioides 7600]EWG52559.1 hypothetical protein FVEG_11282 [Fusarium verticillioides 7600]
MSRGNQRDLARAKNQAKLSGMKKGNQDSGVEMQKKKESDAEKMRRKQAACMSNNLYPYDRLPNTTTNQHSVAFGTREC